MKILRIQFKKLLTAPKTLRCKFKTDEEKRIPVVIESMVIARS